MKPEPLFHYRDYIKSEYWTERKRQYYEMHEKKCAVCGHPDVDLHHIRYGNYGHERDIDLAPLCRVHHQELHDAVGVRKDTKYQSSSFIQDAKEAWERRFSEPITLHRVSAPTIPKGDHIAVAHALHRVAAPIWRLLALFTHSRE